MSRLHVDIRRTLPGFRLEACFDADEQCLAVLGESGSGKSMTLRCIAGIERPDEGVIRLGERLFFDSGAGINLPPQQRRAGYLFQRYALFSHMTVEENIAAGIRGVSRAERKRTVRRQLRDFELDGLERRYANELSGGQQQRVALARLTAGRTDILMLDEPFSALDSGLRWRMEPHLMRILKGYEGPALYVTHDCDEAYRMSERIAVMSGGRIEAIGEKETVFRRPRTRTAAAMTGCKNIAAARKRGVREIYVTEWETALTAEEDISEDVEAIGIRAHDWTPAAGPGTNVLAVREAETSETPFMTTVLFSAGSRRIRWEIDRRVWEKEMQGAIPPYVRIAPEDVLILYKA